MPRFFKNIYNFRYTALEINGMIPVNVVDAKEDWLSVQNHPKDPSKGTRRIRVGPKILIEEADVRTLREGDIVTFINWGNLKILKINKQDLKVINVEAQLNLEDKNYKNTSKITWLVEPGTDPDMEKSNPINCYAVYFDNIINVPLVDKDKDFKNFINQKTRVNNFTYKQVNWQSP